MVKIECEHCSATEGLTLLQCSGGAAGDIHACSEAFAEHKKYCFEDNPEALATAAALAESIKREIIATTKLIQIPERVKQGFLKAGSFSELHDYCDANMLGDGETVWTAQTGLLDGPDADRSVQFNCDILNAAQTLVDTWLKNGRSSVPDDYPPFDLPLRTEVPPERYLLEGVYIFDAADRNIGRFVTQAGADLVRGAG